MAKLPSQTESEPDLDPSAFAKNIEQSRLWADMQDDSEDSEDSELEPNANKPLVISSDGREPQAGWHMLLELAETPHEGQMPWADIVDDSEDSESEPRAKKPADILADSRETQSGSRMLAQSEAYNQKRRATQATEAVGRHGAWPSSGQRADSMFSSQAGARSDSAGSSSHGHRIESDAARQRGVAEDSAGSSCRRPHIEMISSRRCGTDEASSSHGGAGGVSASPHFWSHCTDVTLPRGPRIEMPSIRHMGTGGEGSSSSSTAPCTGMTVAVGRHGTESSSQRQRIEIAELLPVGPGGMAEAARFRSGRCSNASTQSTVSRTRAPPPNKVFMGTLKSIVPDRGYGFIECIDSYAIFGRDVYVDCWKNPDISKLKKGIFVSFNVVVNSKGQPRAANMIPRPPSAMLHF